MKHSKLSALSLFFTILLLTGAMVFRASAPSSWQGYVKPSFPDYAPSGMPDFDEKQGGWNPTGAYTWCGPVAAADTLWWLDSEYESIVYPNPIPPPTISDHFSLVVNFSNWDDHDPRNVGSLIPLLAGMMDTDGLANHDAHVGTRFGDLVTGLQTYLTTVGMSRTFEVDSIQFPNFGWISSEAEKGQGVILYLEFQQYVGGGVWSNSSLHTDSLRGGHFVSVAGENATLTQVLISDPLQDPYEMGTDPFGRQPVVPPLHNSTVHNDTQYVSQDGYSTTQWNPPPPAPGSPYGVPVIELNNYLQTLDPTYPANWHTFIKAAVAISPIPVSEWPGYIKPAYPDYAPSGMPDFDEKQPGWNPTGAYTWCVPAAVADSLWWLDTKYESILDPAPVAPPTISDHFNLVTSTNSTWDDHSLNNVDPLVRNLTWFLDTDGIRTGDGHKGTRYTDIQSGIQGYLNQQGVGSMFSVQNTSYSNFTWIDNETEKCHDVELCLEFWQVVAGPSGPVWNNYTSNDDLNQGHCVACAGANSTLSQILISDPYLDAYEAGNTPGRSPMPEAYPHNAAAHNDAAFVSQDAYNVTPYVFPPGPPGSPPGYPQTVWELQGYAQAAGLAANWHAFIRGAITTSPVEVHDVAITNVFSPKKIICQGFSGNVTTTLANNGNMPENVNVTVNALNVTSGVTKLIGNFTNVSIDSGASINLTLAWNTTGFLKGNYTLIASVDPVSGETNTSNNNFTDSWIFVTMVGDITGPTPFVPDGKCDIRDISIVAKGFGATPGMPGWNDNCDVNNDGIINIKDISIVAKHFGEVDP